MDQILRALQNILVLSGLEFLSIRITLRAPRVGSLQGSADIRLETGYPGAAAQGLQTRIHAEEFDRIPRGWLAEKFEELLR